MEMLDQGAAQAFKEAPFEGLLEFHKAEEGKTYASISLAYRPEEIRKIAGSDESPQLFALLRGKTSEALRFDFSLPTDFADGGTNGSGFRVFQTGTAIDPGAYRLSMGVWLAGRSLAGGRGEDVVAPNFSSSSLELSSVTLASSFERTNSTVAGLKQPFVWGSYKVVPRVARDFPRKEPLRLYYQVYNAANDPASGKPRLDISYAFYLKRAGKFVQGPQQQLKNQANLVSIYELPVESLPAGEWKVQIQVRDAVSNAITTRELLFDLR
jgi:hypothetical protein